MPPTQVTGKTRSNPGTHAHYAGEFGNVPRKPAQPKQAGPGRQPAQAKPEGPGKAIAKSKAVAAKKPSVTKDPVHRANQAEQFAEHARAAAKAHLEAKTDADRAHHAAVLKNAATRALVHARAAAKLAPGSEHSDRAALAAAHAKEQRDMALKAPKEKAKAEAKAAKEKEKAEAKAAKEKEKAEAKKAKAENDAKHKETKAALKKLADSHKETSGAVKKLSAAQAKLEKKLSAAQTKAPVDPKAEHEAAVHTHLNKLNDSMKAARAAAHKAADSAEDTDFESAKKHLADAERHQAEMVTHATAATESAKAHGGAELQEHVRKNVETAHDVVDDAVGTGRSILKITQLDHAPGARTPEQGAFTSNEYRKACSDFVNAINPTQRAAVLNYSDHTDKILNPLLRKSGGTPDLNEMIYNGDTHWLKKRAKNRERAGVKDLSEADTSVGEELKNLDSAIAAHKLDRDTLTYRVLSDPGGKITGSLQEGSVFQDHGYVSTTAAYHALNDFASNNDMDPTHRVDMHITNKAGQSAAPMARLSNYAHEKEVLLPRGSKFKVTKVETYVKRDGMLKYNIKRVHVEVM